MLIHFFDTLKFFLTFLLLSFFRFLLLLAGPCSAYCPDHFTPQHVSWFKKSASVMSNSDATRCKTIRCGRGLYYVHQ